MPDETLVTGDPVAPADPVAPVAPIDPSVGPTDPLTAPVASIDPVAPVDPTVAPVEAPVVNVDPVDAVPPLEPPVPVAPVAPADPVDPLVNPNPNPAEVISVIGAAVVIDTEFVNTAMFPWLPNYVEITLSNGTKTRVPLEKCLDVGISTPIV